MRKKEAKAVNRGIDTTELLLAMEELEKTNGIKKDFLMESIESALVVAYKRNFDCTTENVKVVLDKTDGKMHVYQEKNVVEEVADEKTEISLKEANKKDKNFKIGDIVQIELMPKEFGRIAAQTAKQVITQKIREASRDVIFTEFADKKGEIITGLVQKADGGAVILDLGRIEGIMPKKEQIPTERYRVNDKVKTCIISVEKGVKGSTQIIVSRASTEFVRKLFEIEIPEIYEGLIEIKSIAREAGSRSKVAVYSQNPNIDPVGSCVGQKGIRIQNIINELNGEKIDVIEWDEDPSTFIATSLLPAKVLAVDAREDEKFAQVIVPDDQLSLAIGKGGQNAKLAARLLTNNWKIDIKSESQFRKMLEENQENSEEENTEVETENQEVEAENNENLEEVENDLVSEQEEVKEEKPKRKRTKKADSDTESEDSKKEKKTKKVKETEQSEEKKAKTSDEKKTTKTAKKSAEKKITKTAKASDEKKATKTSKIADGKKTSKKSDENAKSKKEKKSGTKTSKKKEE